MEYKHGFTVNLPWFKQTHEARCYDSQLAMGGTMENWQWVKTLVPLVNLKIAGK